MMQTTTPIVDVAEWLEQRHTRLALHWCANRVIAEIKEKFAVRPPREESEHRNYCELWLQQQRENMTPAMLRAFALEFADKAAELDEETVQRVVIQHVWPQVRIFLLSYALRSVAQKWKSRNMGDAVFLGVPEPLGAYWRVPISVVNFELGMGQIVIDRNGDIVAHLTTTDSELSERLRDYQLSPLAAIAK